MERLFYDPEHETQIRVREVPHERTAGGVSQRLRSWVFEGPGGYICSLVVHRTDSLADLSEPELEAVFLYAVANARD